MDKICSKCDNPTNGGGTTWYGQDYEVYLSCPDCTTKLTGIIDDESHPTPAHVQQLVTEFFREA